jgi:HK97 family phage prohead protease
MEIKQLNLSEVHLKLNDKNRAFEGYASVFGGIDSYGDSIVPGAYENTLKNRQRPIRMRWNHYGPVIGKWTEITEDEKGLLVKGELTPGHSVADDVYASLKHGSVDGMSIGYRVKGYEVEDETRYLKEIELIEISVVEEPADLGARVDTVKYQGELIETIESLKEMEAFLRDATGLSGVSARKLASRMKAVILAEQGKTIIQPDDLVKAFQQINIIL